MYGNGFYGGNGIVGAQVSMQLVGDVLKRLQ